MWKRRWRARSRPNGELPATSRIPERSSLSLRRSCRRSRISICLKLFGCLALIGPVRSFLSALRWASAGHSVVCAVKRGQQQLSVAAFRGCTESTLQGVVLQKVQSTFEVHTTDLVTMSLMLKVNAPMLVKRARTVAAITRIVSFWATLPD
jgi:hypothetical protein